MTPVATQHGPLPTSILQEANVPQDLCTSSSLCPGLSSVNILPGRLIFLQPLITEDPDHLSHTIPCPGMLALTYLEGLH